MAEDSKAPSETICESWEDFCSAIRGGDGTPIHAIFRGQGDHTWTLVPPSARGQFEQVQRIKKAGAKLPSRCGLALIDQLNDGRYSPESPS